MGDRSGIEWTDATWNPIRGCSMVSAGCTNCYAMRQAHRMNHPGGAYEGLTRQTASGPRWTGAIRPVPELLDKPIGWKRPRRIFVNSMSDLFHPDVPEEYIDQVFAVMAIARHHTFQILTKRPERTAQYLSSSGRAGAVAAETGGGPDGGRGWPFIWPDDLGARWPLENVWVGTSVEDQPTANERIPHLLGTPAAVRFLSCEPLLGRVDLDDLIIDDGFPGECHGSALHCDLDPEDDPYAGATVHWVIAGGESGPHARPMHPDWARSLRDQCQVAGVPFFFKQWGEWAPGDLRSWNDGRFGVWQANWTSGDDRYLSAASGEVFLEGTLAGERHSYMVRFGKKKAGRMLDGREWNEMPGVGDG